MLGIEEKCDRLGRIVLARPTEFLTTIDGTATLAEAFIREPVCRLRDGKVDHEDFRRDL